MKKNSKPVYLCAVLLLFLHVSISGCGYTTKASLPGGIKTVQIELFKNNIDITKEVSAKDKYEVYRPDLEIDLRDALINRIFLDGHLEVSHSYFADAIIEGELKEYRKDPLRYRNEAITEYRISLVADVRLKDTKDNEVLLELNNITGDTTFFTTGSLHKTETEALKDALNDLARRIVNGITENW